MNDETKLLLNTFAARYGYKYEDFESSTAFFATLLTRVLKEELEFTEHVYKTLQQIKSKISGAKSIKSHAALKPYEMIGPGAIPENDLSVRIPKLTQEELNKAFADMETSGSGVVNVKDDGSVEHIKVEDFFETIVEEEGIPPSCDANTMSNIKELLTEPCFMNPNKAGHGYECMTCNRMWPFAHVKPDCCKE